MKPHRDDKPAHANRLLARFTPDDLAALTNRLAVTTLAAGDTVAEMHEHVKNAYFPHTAILSFCVDLPSGGQIETALVGSDGAFGSIQALDDRISLHRVSCFSGGEVSVIDLPSLTALMLQRPELRKTLIAYEQFFIGHIQQTAACNARHSVQQRMAKWLLRIRDLAGSRADLTQDQFALMLGVRRTSVTAAADSLRALGLISTRRGVITIEDITGLEQTACECHDELRSHYRRMMD